VTAVGTADIAALKSSGLGEGIWLGGQRRPESGRGAKKYDAAAVRHGFSTSAAVLAAALALGACGTEGIQVAEDEPTYAGALLFSERCSGCHTLKAAGALGSANRAVPNQGPNLDERVESPEDVLFAIRNGGFSGAIMPQNIVTGEEADAVAEFVAAHAGTEIDRPEEPGNSTAIESQEEQDAAIESSPSDGE